MTAKAGLVPIQKLVIRHGQQFMTTVYINPNKANKVDHSKHVQVPAWNLQTPQDLEDEKNKIVKLKDPAEKEALKDEFLKHLKSMGINWKDNSNDAINFMRALMAAKDHLNTKGNATPNPTPQPAHQPSPTTQAAPQPTVGGTPMSKDDAKKLIKDMQKKDSVENIMAKMKAQGLSWSDHTNPAVNKMRAMMALNAHLQSGGTLGGGNVQPAPPKAPVTVQAKKTNPTTPKAPVTVQAKKPDPSLPKAGTVEESYHNATPLGKAIGILTGMVPKDSDAEAFFQRLIKEGKMDVDPSGSAGAQSGDDYGLPKGMSALLSKNGRMASILKKDDFNSFTNPNGTSAPNLFKDKGKKEFEDYKKTYEDYHSKYGTEIMNDKLSYVKAVSTNLDTMESYGMNIHDFKTGQDYNGDLKQICSKISAIHSMTEIDQAWDKLGMETFLNKRSLTERSVEGNPAMQQMLEFGFGGAFQELDFVQEQFMQGLGKNSWSSLDGVLQDVQSGKLTKMKVLKTLAEAVNNPRTNARLENLDHSMANGSRQNIWKLPLIPTMMDQSKLGYFGYREMPSTAKFFQKFHEAGNTFDRAKFESFVDGAVTDRAGLVSPEAKWVKHNLLLYFATIQASGDPYNGKFKMPDNYEPVDYNDWINSSDKIDCFRRHMAIMRKAETTRDKWRKKLTPQQGAATPKVLDKQAIFDAVKNGGDLSQVHIPEHKDTAGMLKCGVEKVPDSEKDTVQKKINEGHDTINHNTFRTKVNNVFRVTNLPYEEKFQEIDKDRNNTGFYYHGTDYRAMQLILGKSGQFVVNKTNVKAGRMLGDGVYLAKQSSKSMQYISSGFNRGIGNKGVLFLCKASLGKAVESTVRGSQYCTQLLNKKDVDTVYMLKPHVVNPEWAVKEEKAVIPRLIIDVEMVNP